MILSLKVYSYFLSVSRDILGYPLYLSRYLGHALAVAVDRDVGISLVERGALEIETVEIGCTAVEGAACNPSSWSIVRALDEDEQANYLEAVMRTFGDEPWWYGMYWWKWEEHVARPWKIDPTVGDCGFTVRGKKAQSVMKKWYEKLQNKNG